MTNTELSGFAQSRKAIFYVVEQPDSLALLSAESVKRHMPDVDTLLVSPNSSIKSLASKDSIDGVVVVPEHGTSNWPLARTFYIMTAMTTMFSIGYKKLIYMYSQTCMCSPCEDVFDLLDHFEFMGVHFPERHSANTVHDIPDAFPEIGIGFIPMRNTNATRLLWADMYEWFTAHEEVYGKNSQGVLRDILWKYSWCDDGPRLHILPPEYFMSLGYQYFVNGVVKVIHGTEANCRKVKGLRLIDD